MAILLYDHVDTENKDDCIILLDDDVVDCHLWVLRIISMYWN